MPGKQIVTGEQIYQFYETIQPSLVEFKQDEVILGALFMIYVATHNPAENTTNEKQFLWATEAMKFVAYWAPQIAPDCGFEHVHFGQRVH